MSENNKHISKNNPFLKDYLQRTNIFFIGIGGIGMSALARYFAVNGKHVAGFDKTTSSITESLIKMGIDIHFNDDIAKIPNQFLEKENTLIVYTPAITDNHSELNYFKNNGFDVLKRAEVLGLITKNTFCFAVAGTHGKTTTSAILGHILKEANVDATSFLGGIAVNYNSNLILGGDKISVVEADEYDRSFLQLSPNIACITSTDADHLDIYGKADELLKSFKDFGNIVSDKLFVSSEVDLEGITFGFDNHAAYQAKNIRIENGISLFDVKTPTEKIDNIKVELPGKHNISNTLAALSMANTYGVSLADIKKGLATFKGIDRRFNIKINTDRLTLIDDYAHHPTEINAVYQTIVALYSLKEKVVIFQPHLFSRTRDFIDDFAKNLAQFDKVILLDIYPARELPIEGVNSDWLASKIKNISNTPVVVVENNVDAIIANISVDNNIVISVLGAGDIGVTVKGLVKQYKKKNEFSL